MSEFRIFETAEFRRALGRLERGDRELLEPRLLSHVYPQLRQMPYYGPNIKKLQGYDPPTWRYRVARFRAFYLIDGEERTVFMLTLDQRKDAYRRG